MLCQPYFFCLKTIDRKLHYFFDSYQCRQRQALLVSVLTPILNNSISILEF